MTTIDQQKGTMRIKDTVIDDKSLAANRQPRVLFVTTPIRPVPTSWPPIAVLTIMKSLRQQGFNDLSFYNIDLLRPSIEEAIDHVKEFRPDILAVSAVVSTAYSYVKELTLGVKSVASDIAIIVGGPIGASAEIVLSKTGVDLLCISEGEPVMSDLLEVFTWPLDFKRLREVRGLVFFDDNRNLISTGYAEEVDKSVIYDLDFEDLREPKSFNQYFPKVLWDDGIVGDDSQQTYRNDLYGGRMFEIPGSKGCVAKCTFCHRWDKGIRYIPVPVLVGRFKTLVADFGVRFIRMADENFGTDKRWLTEFCQEIKKIRVPWSVAGMRVNCIDELTIQMMKDAGCVECLFGMETGSSRMLKVMNKGVKIEDNYNALKLIYAHGLKTTVQLVIGMPGEKDDTIKETAEFLRFYSSLNQGSPFNCSINYAQSLPGTPLYEYARHIGLIGKSIEDEEHYLHWISDKNAGDDSFSLLELTGLSRLKVLSWRPFLTANLLDAYIESFGWRAYFEHLRQKFFPIDAPKVPTGYFTMPKERKEQERVKLSLSMFHWIPVFFRNPVFLIPTLFVHSRLVLYSFTLARDVYQNGVKSGFALVVEHFDITWLSKEKVRNTKYPFTYVSLRRSMKKITDNYSGENEVMQSLRGGRW